MRASVGRPCSSTAGDECCADDARWRSGAVLVSSLSRGSSRPPSTGSGQALRWAQPMHFRRQTHSNGRSKESVMPDYLAPGVYVEEMDSGPRPIEGVPTSTAAFLGETERGPLRPRLVTSFNEYRRWFGGDVRRRPVHAACGERFLRERRQASLRLPHRRQWCDDRVEGLRRLHGDGGGPGRAGAGGSGSGFRTARPGTRTAALASGSSSRTGRASQTTSGRTIRLTPATTAGCRGRSTTRTTTTCRSIPTRRTFSRSA